MRLEIDGEVDEEVVNKLRGLLQSGKRIELVVRGDRARALESLRELLSSNLAATIVVYVRGEGQ